MQINTYKGDQHFEKVLKELKIEHMTVYDIKMYMLGYLMSPENISPFMPLDEILLKDTESEIEFKTDKQAEEFHQSYLGLWNQLTSYEGSSSRYPKLSEERKKFKSREDKINYILLKSEELNSFYMGLDESMGSDYFDQSFDLMMANMPLSMIHDLFVDFDIDYMEEVEQTDEDIEDMLTVAQDFHKIWPNSFKNLNELFLKIRRGTLPLDTPEEIDRKFEQFKEQAQMG